MRLYTIPDFKGDNQTHSLATLFALSPDAIVVSMVIREISGGDATSRIGGADVASNNGLPFTATDITVLPFHAGSSYYRLGDFWIYAASSDTLSVSIFR